MLWKMIAYMYIHLSVAHELGTTFNLSDNGANLSEHMQCWHLNGIMQSRLLSRLSSNVKSSVVLDRNMVKTLAHRRRTADIQDRRSGACSRCTTMRKLDSNSVCGDIWHGLIMIRIFFVHSQPQHLPFSLQGARNV